MEEVTINSFAWGVTDVHEDDDPDKPLLNRTLHITVLANIPTGPGQAMAIPLRAMHLPFGQLDSGQKSYENLALAMRGEEIPPEVQVARPGQMLGHRGPNGVPRS